MSLLRSSSLLLAFSLMTAACAQTRVTDHAVTPEATSVAADRIGRTLLVVETALPADMPERQARAAEVAGMIRGQLAALTGEIAAPDRDEALLAQARAKGLDTVSVVRVEDYVRNGNLYLAVAVPPVSWDTATTVSLRLRVLDARSGNLVADLRRDRVRGGMFTLRSAEDLPDELHQTLRSLIVQG